MIAVTQECRPHIVTETVPTQAAWAVLAAAREPKTDSAEKRAPNQPGFFGSQPPGLNRALFCNIE
jgi:hypothetical protein